MAGELGEWLTKVGLGGYSATFAGHGIDWDVLPDLTDDDLRELGLSLGDRKRLLRAISTLRSLAAPAGKGPIGIAEDTAAQRRQITVMFVDLVDSTPLSEQLDPEDMREVLRAFHAACAAAVAAHDGYIARYMGDGLLVYFGYPAAHEDDAVRAVHGGLGVVANVGEINERLQQEHGVRLRVRVGIHTGLVVVGEVGAGPTRDKTAITGETPNIASRLQSEAAPDTVLVGDTTQRLIEGQFTLEELGPRRLKGVTNAVYVFRVLGAADAVDRFDTRTRRGVTPLVGREAELDMLRRRWGQAREGEMRCVLLGGDAGIGKSRVVRALRDSLADECHETLTLFCSPYHINSALWPVSDWLYRTLRPDSHSEPATLSERLATVLAELHIAAPEAMPLLLAFLELPGDGRHQPADPSALAFKQQLLGVLVTLLGALARRRPVLLIVEDAHWIDPSTLDLLRQVQEQLGSARLLLLVTARPEFRSGWSYPQFVQLHLDRLSRRDRMTMVDRLTGGRTLPDLVMEEIVTKTDGIPLFVEELTKTVIEGGVLRQVDGRYELSGPFQTIAIPDTLRGSLMARLDRLDPEAREVAQVGATLGREFPMSLLARVAGRSAETLEAALSRLVAAEIVLPASSSPAFGTAHFFRHALIQEAAYQSLLLARRRDYHAIIAGALAVDFADFAAMQPEMIAQHWTAANRMDDAIDWWHRAGERAFNRSAYVEACGHLQRGIDLAARQPGNEDARARRALPLLMMRGHAELKSAGRARSTFRECVAVARRVGLVSTMAEAAIGYADAELYLGLPSHASVANLEEALVRIGEPDSQVRCHLLSRLAKALLSTGATERGLLLLEQARTLALRLNDRRGLFDVLVSDLMPNGEPPPSAAQIPARRQKLDLIWQISGEVDHLLKNEAVARCGAAFLEIGDIDGFDMAAGAIVECMKATQAKYDRWEVATVRTLQSLMRGVFDDAEQHALEALSIMSGDDVDVDFPVGVYGMQMFTIRREQGRLAEVAPLVKRFVKENPDEAVWRPGLMLIASDLGFVAQARKNFEAMAASDFELPMDSKRTVTLSYLAEVCVRLGDTNRAERLYELLLPYRDLAIVVPALTLCCGAAARYLGMLAGTWGDWLRAEEHFEAAAAFDEKMCAWPWLAHTRYEHSLVLLARGRAEDTVRAKQLRDMALAGAEKMEMGRLRRIILAAGAGD